MGVLSILLVDDDQNLARTLSYGLQKAMGKKVSVAVCFGSAEALSSLAAQKFDIVVSDYNMPGSSGLELLNRIRQEHEETILILITAYGTDGLEEQAGQLGVGYITKPFEPSSLAGLIKRMIDEADTKRKTVEKSPMRDNLGKPAAASQSIQLDSVA